jgi:hypothetical protein
MIVQTGREKIMSSESAKVATYQSELQRKLENLNYDCSMGYEAELERFRSDHKVKEGDEWITLSKLGGYTFSEVQQYELDIMAGKGSPEFRPAEPAEVNASAHRAALSGLAFSGGGIRSATFNLGVIQALAEMKLLRHFDYLSTVSGGGYIGGWLSKWIRERGGDVRNVEEELGGKKNGDPLPHKQPWPVQFLRRYSNYLTPRTGFFSADTWTLICIYCRNTGLNMTMLFAWLALVFLLPRLLLSVVPVNEQAAQTFGWACAAIAPFLWVVFCIAMSISRKGKLPWHGWTSQSQSAVLLWICIPLIIAGFTSAITLWGHRQALATYWDGLPSTLMHRSSVWLVVPGLLYIGAWGAGWLVAKRLNKKTMQAVASVSSSGSAPTQASAAQRGEARNLTPQVSGHFASAVTALTIGTVFLLKGMSLLVAAEGTPKVVLYASATTKLEDVAPLLIRESGKINAVQLATFGMPVMLLIFGATVTLMIGLIGRLYRDQSREWWARQGAWTVICAICWVAVVGGAFYVPPLLDYAWTNAMKTTSFGAALTALATAMGLKAGSGKTTTGTLGVVKSKELIAQVAPYAFMLLTIAALTTVLQWLVAPQPVILSKGTVTEYITKFEGSSASVAGALWSADRLPGTGVSLIPLMVGLLVTALVLGWRVDVNKFSLYMMYRLRLVRAYFGASSNNRAPHPFTGFDPQDDCKLSDLLEQTKNGSPQETGMLLQRPYHLINAAVNMVGGKELAWQTRKAGNFCFSPAFSGFELPQMPPDGARNRSPRGAYRPTDRYASRTTLFKDDDAGVHLGMAVAVSGAAASPNMGYHSSPPLSFLMTLFNLRLGRWSPNPIRQHAWERAAPRIGIFSILAELFGLTDTSANFLYLSDGGHFENLGLYELVRRRCRLIVVVDASADSQYEFGDLGNAIRKCQTDFNIPIYLKTTDIKSLGSPPAQSVSFVTGTIQYSRADGIYAPDGVLLYIKPIIVGDENADIANYSKMHPGFPHQSTGDQWFDEDQFESYRMLGLSAATAALKAVSNSVHSKFGDSISEKQEDRSIVTAFLCEELKKNPK